MDRQKRREEKRTKETDRKDDKKEEVDMTWTYLLFQDENIQHFKRKTDFIRIFNSMFNFLLTLSDIM